MIKSLLSRCALAACLIAAAPWHAPAATMFDGASAQASTSSGRSLAWTHELGAGWNRLVVVAVTLEDNQDRDTGTVVTFGGVPMLPVPGGVATSAAGHGFLNTTLYYLLEASLPPAGTYQVRVSLSQTVHEIGGGSLSLSGMAQAPPEAVASAATEGLASSVETSINTVTPGAWIFEAAGADVSVPLSPAETTPSGYAATGRRVSVGGRATEAASAGPYPVSWQTSRDARMAIVAAAFAPYTPDFGLIGWATANGGTTGGEGGLEVVVDTLAALRFYAGHPDPYVIKIAGTILGNETVRVRSNKSILGLGADARLLGVGLQIGWNSEFGEIRNVIVRNVTFEKALAPIDGVFVSYGAQNVWIDHCAFLSDLEHGVDYYDGLLDITNGADFVTVSWSRFTQHFKTSLVGSSDTSALDPGHLTITYHHNAFINSEGRNPSVRFGLVHVFNNYYLDIPDYAVASRMNAEVVIEHNWFENVRLPIRADTSLSPVAGFVRGVETNAYVNSGPNSIVNPPATWIPPYGYDLDPVELVPEYVGRWAGVGVVTFDGEPPLTSAPVITGLPASQEVELGQPVTFSVLVDGTWPFTYQWLKDEVAIPGAEEPALAIESVELSDIGNYTVSVSNAVGSVTGGPAVLSIQTPGGGGEGVFLRERFADGTRTNQALPESSAWFTSAGSSNLVVVGSELRQIASSSRTLLTYFTDDQGQPVTLAEGEMLRTAFTFRMTALDPQGDNFRFGLLRSVANPSAVSGTGFVADGPPNTNARVTGDFGSSNPGSNVFSLYSGYAALTTVRADLASTNPVRLYARVGSNGSLIGSTSPYTLLPAGPPTAALLAEVGVSYRATLSVWRTAAGMTVTCTIVRVADNAVMMSQTAQDASLSATAFDTLAFYISKGSAPTFDLFLSSVDIERVVP